MAQVPSRWWRKMEGPELIPGQLCEVRRPPENEDTYSSVTMRCPADEDRQTPVRQGTYVMYLSPSPSSRKLKLPNEVEVLHAGKVYRTMSYFLVPIPDKD